MTALRLSLDTLGEYQAALRTAGVDGWLFYDFRGINLDPAHLFGFLKYLRRFNAAAALSIFSIGACKRPVTFAASLLVF
jgi:hypothetical protein